MKKGAMKWIILSAFAAAGLFTATRVPEAVTSFLPHVGTINATETEYRETVLASGSIVCGEKWYVNASVAESEIRKISAGQSAEITGAAFDSGIYTATVRELSDTARQVLSGTVLETVVDIVLEIDNPDENLRSGYTAQAIVHTSEPRMMKVLPYEAICQDERGEYVYVYSGGCAERRDITTGAELGDGTEIISGISIRDEVIQSPSSVEAGALVIKEEAE